MIIKKQLQYYWQRWDLHPDYKYNHVKTTISDLKDEYFAKAADKYKNNISKNKGNYDDKSDYE